MLNNRNKWKTPKTKRNNKNKPKKCQKRKDAKLNQKLS